MKFYTNNLDGRKIRLGPYTTSKIEIIDLIKSWVAISLAFTILQGGLGSIQRFGVNMLFSAITVGIAFLFHEIGHKVTAQRYGCFAEFRSQDNMLGLAVILSFLGFIFFAPGAVLINGPVGKKRNGIISASGPGVNFALAIIFLILGLYFGALSPMLNKLFIYGHGINTWIGLFNMIPFMVFDGKKIMAWSKPVYWSMVAIGLLLLFSGGLIGLQL